jgi:SAM-dependent methyltransferase
MLALGFAPRVKRVAGADPEPAMLAAARAAAAQAGTSLTLHECRIEDLAPEAGPFAVATIGRALHWLEPQATLAALERLLSPAGRIVVCGAFSAPGQNPWLAAYDSLREGLKAAGDEVNYRLDPATFFAGSRFATWANFEVRTEQVVSVEILAGRLLSMSNTSPAVLGHRVGRIADEVREALAPFLGPDGAIREVIETRATVFAREARNGRPAPGG